MKILQIFEFADALLMATLKGLKNVFPIFSHLRKPIMSLKVHKGQTIFYTIQEFYYISTKSTSSHALINDM
jgi:hypothetical protein